MTIYKLPTGYGVDSLDTDIVRTLDLDGTTYDIRYRWNTREETWTLICSRSGGDIIFSTAARTGRVLNSLYKHRPYCPQGNMMIIDIAGSGERVDFDNFTITGRYRLYYNSVT